MRRMGAALVHHPVVDRQGQVVTTAITNIDLHDIARSALTFGLDVCYVVHPIAAQRELALRVQNHWVHGSGARRIPDRSPALATLRIVSTLAEARADFSQGEPHELWVTSAAAGGPVLSYEGAREVLTQPGPAVLLVFGTGWGLSPELIEAAERQLEPIASARSDGYNHLSVRAAAAITFDRLCGRPGPRPG